jgi:hypothetical protein
MAAPRYRYRVVVIVPVCSSRPSPLLGHQPPPLPAAADRCREVLSYEPHCTTAMDEDVVIALVLLGRVF